jgi:hypothetical protein
MTTLQIGMIAAAVALEALVTAPADAQQRKRAQSYNSQWQGRVTASPKSTTRDSAVCWNGCNKPGSIVMGTDPDPFIRSQILRDASGFFGGGDP